MYKRQPHAFINKQKYYLQVKDFIRKLQWFTIIKNQNFETNRIPISKSNKWPNEKLINKNLKQICNKITNSCSEIIQKSFHPEDSNDYTLAQNLKNEQNFIITKVDKGSNWAIISREKYNTECFKQLNNDNFYRSINDERSTSTKAAVNRFSTHLHRNKLLTHKEYKSLTINDYSKRKFYILPKIHKTNWPEPNYMPPGRPIINCKNSECDLIGKFIDHFLKKIVVNQPSFISDTFHFISKIEKLDIKNNYHLFTLDIINLYTNIPIESAITSIRTFFNRYPDNTRSDSVILTMIDKILSNNDFYFNDNLFLQTKGIAMGQPFAPSVANLYVALFEENFFATLNKKPILWLRYIDDIFGVWDGSVKDYNYFIDQLNNYDRNLQFTSTINSTSINSLDLSITKSLPHLSYCVSFKEHNSHSILSKESEHPKHVFRGVLYSQIRRWAALSSEKSSFDAACRKVFPIWRERGYTSTEIHKSKKKVLTNLHLYSGWSHGFHSCQKCNVCPFAVTRSHVYLNNFHFRIVGNYECSSDNIIYVIYCKQCNKFYIGQTENTVHHRISEHLNNIINFTKTEKLYVHFRQCGTINFKCFILESIKNKIKRVKKENFLIKKFNTVYPNGLNVIQNKKCSPTLISPFSNVSKKIISNVKNICEKNDVSFNAVFKLNKNLQNILKP